MGYSLVNKSTGKPVANVMNYSVKRDAIPLNPDNGSTAIPSMSFQVATDPDVDTGALMSQTFALESVDASTGTLLEGTAVSYSESEKTGQVSIDTETLFARLNTEQTVLPLLGAYDVSRMIKYWAQECGVPAVRVPGTVQAFVSGDLEVGYSRSSPGSWVMVLGLAWQLTTRLTGRTGGSYTAPPLLLMAGQSTLHSFKLRKDTKETLFQWSYGRIDVLDPTVSNDTDSVTIARVGNNAVCTVRSNGVSKTLTAALTGASTATSSAEWEVHLLSEVLPGTSTVRYSLRVVPLASGAAITNATTTDTVANSFMTKNLGLSSMQGMLRGSMTDQLERGQWASLSKASVLPDAPLEANFSESWGDRVPPAATAVQGFQGNVWSAIVQIASIYGLNVTLLDGRIRVTPMLRKATFTGGYDLGQMPLPKGNVQLKQAARTPSRKVEVVRQKLKASNGLLLWKADSVYSVERGETQRFTVQAEATFQNLDSITAVAGVANPKNVPWAQYVVTGADGYIVDPAWWVNNGGSLQVNPTGKSGEIEIIIQAPGIETVRAPYRISEGAADRPALYIFGRGITREQETLQFYTSAPESSQEVGTTFDSPFVSDVATANNVGYLLALHHGGANTELSLTSPINHGFEVSNRLQGRPVWDEAEGRFFYHKGAIYRSVSTTENPQSISMDAENTTMVAFVNEYWQGKTVKDFNTYHADKLVRDVNRSPLPMYLS